MSNLYPGANIWEDKGSYQVKHRIDNNGKCTEIFMAARRVIKTIFTFTRLVKLVKALHLEMIKERYTIYLIMTSSRFFLGRDLSGKCDRDYCKFG
jgi:hypothetical protein